MTAAALRVVTYNVRHLRDDDAALVRVIRGVAPDVLCLQETPRHPRWRARLARLARESDLLYACGGRPAGNVAVLTHLRVDVLATHERKLTKHPGLHQRGLAGVDLRVGDARVTVASVHLGLDAQERVGHAAEVLTALDATCPSDHGDGVAVVAGDLNERPGGAAWEALGGRLRDAWALAPTGGELTYPASGPRARIDAVLVDPGVRVVSCGVPPLTSDMSAATDHRPVVAELLFGESAPIA
jgi:endonuclease/exonuclease/phosphatase family metal-dependent hydrolase